MEEKTDPKCTSRMVDQENIRIREKVAFKIIPYQLIFKKPARTSRDTLVKRSIFYLVFFSDLFSKKGIGECAPIFGLSPEMENSLPHLLEENAQFFLEHGHINAQASPAVRFALESAWQDYLSGGSGVLSDSLHDKPIPINGLVWMNQKEEMLEEALMKLQEGYSTIKLKVGGIQFEDELSILEKIRSKAPKNRITIRLDANGAFSEKDVYSKLHALSAFDIHSIEQPIKAGQIALLKDVCSHSPIPIALDEELIGITELNEQLDLLHSVRPQFIVLKPTLHGGFQGCDQWIECAEKLQIGWWATSALESSIGLNAIAHWVERKNVTIPQGLGTGALYMNNLPPQWRTENGFLSFVGERDLATYQMLGL